MVLPSIVPLRYNLTVAPATAVPETVVPPLYNVVCVITGVAVAVEVTQEYKPADSHLPGSVVVTIYDPAGTSLVPPEQALGLPKPNWPS